MRSKLYALSLSLVGGAMFTALAISGGCSSSDNNNDNGGGDTGTTEDSSVDTKVSTDSKTDTKKDTTPVDTAPYSCAAPLPADFKCDPPTITGKPASACSEDDLQSFVTACIAASFGVGSGCSAWISAHSACNACISGFSFATSSGGPKVYPDRDQCFYQFFDDTCKTDWNCMFECDQAVCNSADTPCDTSAGSGADAASSNSEYQDCVNAERAHGGTVVPKGVCYDVAAGAALYTCYPKLPGTATYCVVNEEFTPSGPGGAPDLTSMRSEIVEYLRGACRDDGDWTHAEDACASPPCETGTDAGGETSSDAAVDADETATDTSTDETTTDETGDADDGSSPTDAASD